MVLEGSKRSIFEVLFEFLLDTQVEIRRLKFREWSELEMRT